MGADVGVGKEKQQAAKAEVSQNEKLNFQAKTEAQKDQLRKERFETLINTTPAGVSKLGDPVGIKPYFANFNIARFGSYDIERTTSGYKFSAFRVYDKENHVRISDYYFDKNGKFIEKIKGRSTDNSHLALREVDRILPQLGAQNETWHLKYAAEDARKAAKVK